MNEAMKLELIQEIMPKSYRRGITQELVDTINKVAEDPDYGEHFRQSILTHASILNGKEPWSMKLYIEAIKYYGLTAMGVSQVDAYCRVYPERLQARLDRGQTKVDMGGEASRFNGTDIVNKIREQAMVPVNLLNQDVFQEAINQARYLMMYSDSDKVQGDMALGLIRELRPPEIQKMEMQVGMNEDMQAAHEKQTKTLVEIAMNQRKLLEAGVPLHEIQRIHNETVDVDIDEEDIDG